MDPKTRELIDDSAKDHRDQSLIYLAGLTDALVLPMGRGAGTMLTDDYGDPHLDFSSGGLNLVTGHRDPNVIGRLMAQGTSGLYRGDYGDYFDHFVLTYAKMLSERFPADLGVPRQVLFTSSVYEARMAAAQICVDPASGNGAHFLFLLDESGAPRDGGEVQDEVHRAKAQGLRIVADESFTGFGRSGLFCYYEHFGLSPDLVVLGAAGGAGLPFGAVIGPKPLFTGLLFDQFFHVVDVNPNPLICAVGTAVLEQIDDTLLEHVRSAGEIFGADLRSVCEQFAHVLTAVVGTGFMWTLRLNATSRADEFRSLCRNGGLLIGPTLRLTPPLNASNLQLSQAVDVVAAACISMGNAR